jgi:O-antigen ligase
VITAIVAAAAWGALAFGAVYPWAYTTLAIACASIGIIGLVRGRRRRPPLSALARALGAIAAVIALQLVPLPASLLARVSPGTDAFLRQYDLGYAPLPASFAGPPSGGEATPARPARPTSIAPRKTALALALFSALALFLLGATRAFSLSGSEGVARGILALGLLITVLAIVQIAINPNAGEFTLIYGFWRPRTVSMPFGPFVNPNHYAGWMLMAVPLGLGLAYGTFERARHMTVPDGTRPSAVAALAHSGGLLAMMAFACLAMSVSLLMTKSRSGIACFAVVVAMSAGMVILRQQRGGARAAAAAGFALFFAGTIAWAGVDTLFEKFTTGAPGLSSAASRMIAWKDTVRIIHDDPVTGTGLDTYGTAMILYGTRQQVGRFQEAHNDYLQLAAEGGLLVVVPAACAVALFAAGVRRRFREAPKEGTTYWTRVGAVIGLTGIALQSLVEFSLQMPGNAALFAVLAAIALHQSPRLVPRIAPRLHAASQ